MEVTIHVKGRWDLGQDRVVVEEVKGLLSGRSKPSYLVVAWISGGEGGGGELLRIGS